MGSQYANHGAGLFSGLRSMHDQIDRQREALGFNPYGQREKMERQFREEYARLGRLLRPDYEEIIIDEASNGFKRCFIRPRRAPEWENGNRFKVKNPPKWDVGKEGEVKTLRQQLQRKTNIWLKGVDERLKAY